MRETSLQPVRSVAFAVLAMMLPIAITPAAGQRLGLPPDSIQRLLVGLAPEARLAAGRFVTGNDSVARVALRTFRFDPAAGPLLLAILKRDP